MVALAACVVSRFEIVPVHGLWRIASHIQESLALSVFVPARDIRVRLHFGQPVGCGNRGIEA